MKQIKLTQGYYVKVDDEDYEWLNEFKWCVKIISTNIRYAQRTIRKNNGSYTTLSMHRLIVGLTNPKIFTDHIDGNGLNNQRSNLRVCTPKQNQRNRKSCINSSSKYLRVYKNKYGKYIVNIKYDNKQIYLGTFIDERRAAIEYDKAAIIYFGEFASLNILKIR